MGKLINNILIIDDETDLLQIVCSYLVFKGYKTQIASSLKEAETLVTTNHDFDLIISDIKLKDGLDTELITRDDITSYSRGTYILYLTKYDFDLPKIDKVKWLKKPFSNKSLYNKIKEIEGDIISREIEPILNSEDFKSSSIRVEVQDTEKDRYISTEILEFSNQFILEVFPPCFHNEKKVVLQISFVNEKNDIICYQGDFEVIRWEKCGRVLVLKNDQETMDAMDGMIIEKIKEALTIRQERIIDFLNKAKGIS